MANSMYLNGLNKHVLSCQKNYIIKYNKFLLTFDTCKQTGFEDEFNFWML